MKRGLVILFFGIFLISLINASNCGDSDATTWCVELTDTTIDGNNFCGGVCDSSDKIILRAGQRGDLRLQDFNGNGNNIIITNEDSSQDTQVVLTSSGDGSWGVIDIINSRYIDLRGDGDPEVEYGIKTIDDGDPARAGIRVFGDGDYIKISNLEFTEIGTHSSIGINVGIPSEDVNVMYSNFEIHHNWFHDLHYSAMYLGRNKPLINDDPYVTNFEVHDNLIEDIQGYGMTHKGVSGGVSNIYRNTIKRLTYNPQSDTPTDDCCTPSSNGIGTAYTYNGAVINIYDNWIEDTYDEGIKLCSASPCEEINAYANVVLNSGQCTYDSDSQQWEHAHGIRVGTGNGPYHVYDNVIIECGRYGILVKGAVSTGSTTVERNIVANCGYGGWEEYSIGDTIWGEGVNENIYETDPSDIGFVAWSDDGNYSNDNFNLSSGTTPTCSQGQITSTCLCNSVEYSFGYCCSNVWQSSACSVSTNNLIAHWKLDEISGTTADDSAGSNDGTLMNNPTPTWTTGHDGNALSFDGVDDNVFANSFSGLSNFKGSVSMWIYPESMGEGNKGVIFNMDNSATSGRYGKLVFANTNALKWDVWEGANFLTRTTSNNILTMNNWNHLVYTFTGTGYSNMKIYINGAEVSYVAGSGTGSPILNNDEFYFGSFNSAGLDAFDGLIDDVRIYNYALSSTEISNIYNAVSNCPSGADSNTDGVVDISELMNYISKWKAGTVLIGNLMTAIGEWKNGC